jgi:ATP-dependent exoDNAse (exonuclease V) alpha subunit
MAIYHVSVKTISRSRGQSALASAAYRSGSRLHDERIGKTFDFTDKPGVEHTEILAPEGAPRWVFDREKLWNKVEAVERRKDAQLAREVEIALPVELKSDEQVALLRDFSHRAFVSQGMVVDLAVHRDNPKNPHAHLLLTTRSLGAEGFGPKRRDWNDTEKLLSWREQWADLTNEHLARAGIEARIDAHSLAAQGLNLTPGRKLGISAERQQQPNLPNALAEKLAEQRAIAHENGERILQDPALALKALSHHQATFTEADVAKWLHGRTDGAEQFGAAYLKVTTHPELAALGEDERGKTRFTTHEILRIERDLLERSHRLHCANTHAVAAPGAIKYSPTDVSRANSGSRSIT